MPRFFEMFDLVVEPESGRVVVCIKSYVSALGPSLIVPKMLEGVVTATSTPCFINMHRSMLLVPLIAET